MNMRRYFTNFSKTKASLYVAVLVYVIGVAIMSVIELMLPTFCAQDVSSTIFPNPAYHQDPCRLQRYWYLLGLNRSECSFARRLLASVVLGGVVGWERRDADRPAGIRTMALVSLGACLFTINSAFAFADSSMAWDASRISAAIPSGVGFLGAGLIFKEQERDELGKSSHTVHGLTTAASLWMSAAVGTACAGELYFSGAFSTALLLTLLRFGPRLRDLSYGSDNVHDMDTEMGLGTPGNLKYSASVSLMGSSKREEEEPSPLADIGEPSERQSLTSSVRASVRQRPALGGMV